MAGSELSTEVRNPVEVIRERIQGDWAALMPDEKWTEFVQAEVNRFITDERPKYQGNPTTPSPLKVMIREELQKQFLKGVQEELSKPEYGNMWRRDDEEPAEAIQRLVTAAAPQMIESFFTKAVEAVVRTLQAQQQF